jgi:6-phosphogluconate dehydrogenase
VPPTTPYLPATRAPGVELGVVGLGRTGQTVCERVIEAGHDVVAVDIDDALYELAGHVDIESLSVAWPAETTEGSRYSD